MRPRRTAAFVLVVASYVGAAKLGIALSVAHGVITPVWAPAGIALAAVLLFGPRFAFAVALGALIANATSGASLPVALFIAFGNALAALAGRWLLLRVGFRPSLARVRDVFALVFLAAAASTTIAATNGVTTLWAADDLSGSSYGASWLLWWIGDGMGVLIVAPLLLVWATVPRQRPSRSEALEAVVLLTLLCGVSSFVFLAGYWHYPHVLFPLLIWAALRFRQHGAVSASFVVSTIAVTGAVTGQTPMGGGSATEVVQILEGLIAGIAVGLLILGAVLAERDAAAARLSEAQEVAHLGSWEWDVPANRVTWSDELFRIYGLEPRSVELTYETYLERVHPEDRELARRTVESAAADGSSFAFEHRTIVPSGKVRWLLARGRAILDEAGRPSRLVGTSQDITERKRVDELRDTILSTVSHELRTPLTSIIGFALTLKHLGRELPDQTYEEIVEHLAGGSLRLERLLSDLLDVDRLRLGLIQPSFRPTDLAQLVGQVVADQQADSGRIALVAEPAVAEVDPPKIERIVENLLVNAFKYTPPDTPISVWVENRDDAVLIAVDDRGPGVAEGNREAVFKLFNRGETVDGIPGAGLGLSLVAQFASLHGGRAWVEGNPGGGASFRVLLPTHRREEFIAAANSAAKLDRR